MSHQQLEQVQNDIRAAQHEIKQVEIKIQKIENAIEVAQANNDQKEVEYLRDKESKLLDKENKLLDKEKQLRDEKLLLMRNSVQDVPAFKPVALRLRYENGAEANLASLARTEPGTLVQLMGGENLFIGRDVQTAPGSFRVVSVAALNLFRFYALNMSEPDREERHHVVRITGASGCGKSQAVMMLAAAIANTPGFTCYYFRDGVDKEARKPLAKFIRENKRSGAPIVIICDQLRDDEIVRDLQNAADLDVYVILVASANLPQMFDVRLGHSQARPDDWKNIDMPYSADYNTIRTLARLLGVITQREVDLPEVAPTVHDRMEEMPPPRNNDYVQMLLWCNYHILSFARFVREGTAERLVKSLVDQAVEYVTSSPSNYLNVYDMVHGGLDAIVVDRDINLQFFNRHSGKVHSDFHLTALHYAVTLANPPPTSP